MAKRKKKPVSQTLTTEEQLSAQMESFRSLLSAEEYAELQREVERPLPLAIRLNPLKGTSGLHEKLEKRYGWRLTPIPFCSEGYRVEPGQGPLVSAVLEHKTGQYYIQEAASMLPVELFTPQGTDDLLTLDLAASPGGKTTHLVAKQKDEGLVMANDSSQGRIQALKVVLQHWGATNTVVTRFPGEKFGTWFPNAFDRALIDAPCSMQGLRTADSHDSRPVTEKESRALAKRQAALLTSALQAVRVGGEVVYSTCTLLPQEDEGVVEQVIKEWGGSVTLMDAQDALPKPAPGVQAVDGQRFAADMSKVVRLWPHRHQTAGFFACLFKKTGEMKTKAVLPPEHSMEAAGFFELTLNETQKFAREFTESTGFALLDYLESEGRTLVRRDQRVFLFPRLLLERFRGLPVQSAGILLGEAESEGFVPSNEWALRFGSGCAKIVMRLDEEHFLRFCGGEDLTGIVDPVKSATTIRVVMDEQGRLAGRGKMVGGTLKNLSARYLS